MVAKPVVFLGVTFSPVSLPDALTPETSWSNLETRDAYLNMVTGFAGVPA